MSERPVFPLPLEIDQIDAPWLTTALRIRAPGITVRNCSVVDVNRGTSTKIRIDLELDQAGRDAKIPPRVILKGGFETHSRKMDYMYQWENRFYHDVQPVLGLRSPVCYFAESDPKNGQSIIIMEDLVARGVTFCHPLRPQGYDEVARRLTRLAEFHSRGWEARNPDTQPLWNLLGDKMQLFNELYAPHYLKPDVWQRFVGLPRGAAASVRFHDGEWMRDALAKLELLEQRLPKCVIHADTHLGNLYVDPDGEPGFFDSLPCRAAWEIEVSYHIACALDPPDRRRWERKLIEHYLAQLARSGVKPPPLDEAMRNCAAFLAYGYFVFLVNESFLPTESANTAYTARFSDAMLDNHTLTVLQDLPAGPPIARIS